MLRGMKMKKIKQENKTKENGRINKKMSFAQIFEIDRELAIPLMEKGMHCCGCPMSMGETLEDGAMAHGLDPDELATELNSKLGKKNKKAKNKEKK
jgi:hybrid cluster-associated redox disulfide protein